MLIKGSLQRWDKNGDGIVDIADLSCAIDEMMSLVKDIKAMSTYISEGGELPPAVDATVEIKIGG